MKILVAGMLAADPHQGGATWAVLQYVLGLERLGHEVHVVDPAVATAEAEAYFDGVARAFALRAWRGRYGGPAPDLLLNVSGMLRDEKLASVPIRVYLDLDPVFNQLWYEQGIDVGFAGHTHFVTVGRNVPACGLGWIATFPPVVLEHWPVAEAIELDALTGIGNWRGYGSIERDGVHYGQRAHSLRRFLDLPARTGERIALALAIHPDETRDLEALHAHGWELLDPRAVAGSPAAYAAFVRGSKAELGIAKSGYAVARSGWFSDRSACYLASGRPVIAQETGFSSFLPTGAGLFAFETGEEVAAAVVELRRDYGRHARAARAIAEEFLDSDRVLTRLLREVGALEPARRRALHELPDDELAAAVGGRIVRRRPSAYRSSAPLLEIDAAFSDGTVRALLVKDLSRAGLTERALRAKPEFLADPLREIETYRSVLAGTDLGAPALYAADVDRRWLVLEKVAGVELYQVGELEVWQQALRWLARMHDRFAGADLPAPLIRYDRDFLRLWLDRARALSGLDGLERYDRAIDRLVSLPRTLLHGELYASNVIVAGDRVCAVDWEMAGVGPGVVDVAALTMGWDDPAGAVLTEAYRTALADPPPAADFERDLDCARLHLGVQWLGWSPDWSPPPEHAHDFRVQVHDAAERLGL